MIIYIDADGCPVVDITIGIAGQRNIGCVIVCDTAHEFVRAGVKTVIAEKGADSTDFKLVNMIKPGDIAVTQDYGLAAMCLARGAFALNQNGIIFSERNIDGLLFSRSESSKLRMSGGRTKGHRKRTAENDEAYKRALNTVINTAENES